LGGIALTDLASDKSPPCSMIVNRIRESDEGGIGEPINLQLIITF